MAVDMDRLGELASDLCRLVDKLPEEECDFGDDGELEFKYPPITESDARTFERIQDIADELWRLHRDSVVLEDAA